MTLALIEGTKCANCARTVFYSPEDGWKDRDGKPCEIRRKGGYVKVPHLPRV